MKKNYDGTAVFSSGGGGEIRTHDTVSRMTVFKTVAFNHSATPPPEEKVPSG
jgi:hypothetical protein